VCVPFIVGLVAPGASLGQRMPSRCRPSTPSGILAGRAAIESPCPFKLFDFVRIRGIIPFTVNPPASPAGACKRTTFSSVQRRPGSIRSSPREPDRRFRPYAARQYALKSRAAGVSPALISRRPLFLTRFRQVRWGSTWDTVLCLFRRRDPPDRERWNPETPEGVARRFPTKANSQAPGGQHEGPAPPR